MFFNIYYFTLNKIKRCLTLVCKSFTIAHSSSFSVFPRKKASRHCGCAQQDVKIDQPVQSSPFWHTTAPGGPPRAGPLLLPSAWYWPLWSHKRGFLRTKNMPLWLEISIKFCDHIRTIFRCTICLSIFLSCFLSVFLLSERDRGKLEVRESRYVRSNNNKLQNIVAEIPTPGDEKTGDFSKITRNYSKCMGSWSGEKPGDYRKYMENLAGRW